MDIPIRRECYIASNKSNIKDFYQFDSKTLGEGSFGFVKPATRLSDSSRRAVKIIPKKKVKREDTLWSEIVIMKQIDHPNIIQLYETFEDSQYIYLCMEICQGGELFDKILEVDHFSEKKACEIFTQIISAVAYLHSKNIVHRDLKPENFLFYSNDIDSQIKLIDFGLAKLMTSKQTLKTKGGTCYYIAPEILTGVYTEKCDLWSLGVILFMILSGFPPFNGETETEILQSVLHTPLNFHDPIWQNISGDAKNLIYNLLNRNPSERFSAADVLNHRWVSGFSDLSTSRILLDCNKLIQYQQSVKLKRAVLNYIATQCSSDEITQLTEIFKKIDTNNDGQLSIFELREALGHSDLSKPYLDNLITTIDSDKSGKIDFTEFIAAVMDRGVYMCQEKLWNAFKRFDIDNSGRITADELQDILDQNHLVKDPIFWSNMVKEADTNGDGTIDFQEFVKMMEQGQPWNLDYQ